MKGQQARISTEDRFIKQMNQQGDDECWEWQGPKDRLGYGMWHDAHGEESTRIAHRVVYLRLRGSIPEGLELDHLCRNTSCVNPNHLEPVTGEVNRLRGLAWDGEEWIVGKIQRSKTHCPNGHAYAGDNLRVETRSDGKGMARRCRICDRAKMKRYLAKKKAQKT